MKMFIISLVILAVVIVGITINSIAVSNISDSLLDQISKLPAAGSITGSEAELEEVKKLQDLWDKNYFVVSLSVLHDDLEKVDEYLASLHCALQTVDNPGYCDAYEQLIIRIEHLKKLATASIDNIL